MHTASLPPGRFTRAIGLAGLFTLLCLPLVAAPDAYGAGPVQTGATTLFMPECTPMMAVTS